MTGRVIGIFNGVGRSCRVSGISSLSTCSKSHDLALSSIIAAEATSPWDRHPTATTPFNHLLGSLLKCRKHAQGCDLLQRMEDLGVHPDPVTFEMLISHACRFRSTDLATEFVDKMLSDGLNPRITTHAILIKSYFRSGRIADARRYLDDMSVKDRCATNANYSLLARLYWRANRIVEAGGILDELMADKGLRPNFAVYRRIVRDLHRLGERDFALDLKNNFSKFPSP